MDSWNLREEILRTLNQWYLVIGLIVLGGIAGYLVTFLLPAPYRATADLYVGINVTRVNEMEYLIPLAKTEPLNLDDYKNWQLKQVADILNLDMVLEDTLTSLREKDPYWQDISINEFKGAIDIYWYDAGIWRLEVVNQNRSRAKMAVQAWLNSGYAKISELLNISEVVFSLDGDLQILTDANTLNKKQITRLETFLDSSDGWLNTFASLSEEEPLPVDLRNELEDWVLVYRKKPELWQIPVGNYPQPDQSVSSYETWLSDAQVKAAAELKETQKQYDLLIKERENILPQYHQALEDSLGLSANIVLQENSSSPDVSQVRTTGTNSFVGAILGLLAWMILAVVRIRGARHA